MSAHHLSLLLALGSTLTFATSSLVYAEYSRRVSVLWMNCFKCAVAFAALVLTVPFATGWHAPSTTSLCALLLSGLIGLNVGDLFLLSAFAHLGVARTLVLFGFQPLFVGLAAHFLFGQAFDSRRLLAVLFLIGCLFTFSLERFRREKRWDLTGLIHALIGVSLDTCGVLLTRGAFDASPQIAPLEGNFYRCFGALLGFVVMARFRPIGFVSGFRRWETKGRVLLVTASLGGTYFALLFYLSALKIGHLASIAGIAITGPIFATALESVVQRKAPSRYLIVAFLFFSAGFYILMTS